MSRDEVADSRGFAKDYGIAFPLISDSNGDISRALVGIDDNDHSIPGVVVIRRDGAIVFRQVARSKDDRLTTAQVLAAADRALGTSGAAAPVTRSAVERVQLRLQTGGGQIRLADRWRPTGVSRLTTNVPLGRYLVAGAGFATEYREAQLSLITSLGVRLPIWNDIGAIELAAEVGLPGLAPGIYSGLRSGMWFAWTPRWALHLEAAVGGHDTGGDDPIPAWSATFGVSRSFGR